MDHDKSINRDETERVKTKEQTNHPRLEVASMSKVSFHGKRLKEYLEGKAIFPITLELDLTSECTRACPECPSATAIHHHSLSMEFVERLFGYLEGRTRGLILTGGEPTMAPLFPRALHMARLRGFEEIAVVTNGSLLDLPRIAEALLAYVTTIRLSMYDWDEGSHEDVGRTLRKIESLRNLIERTGSKLQIGISFLTSTNRAMLLGKMAESVQSVGAHWIYFHPLCTKWGLGCPELSDQEGVLAVIRELQHRASFNNRVFMLRERYEHTPLEFDGYHTAHFLLVIGADGKNYLAPEVKYQAPGVIADLENGWNDTLLQERPRLARISSVTSRAYPALKSRHRGILYNHFIEHLKRSEKSAPGAFEGGSTTEFLFPHIL
ncbi:MAG: radical SAM protein [Deltaproteobacteria bacterium]|nr:radical SAM protein [Deltaproteobacteria bacterium]